MLAAYFTGQARLGALLCSRGDTLPYAYQRVAHKPLEELTMAEWACLACAATLHIPVTAVERPLAIKSHHARTNPFGVPVVPPELCSKAVYIVRDPRDVALSLARHLGVDTETSVGILTDPSAVLYDGKRPPHFISDWSRHAKSWMGAKDMQVLMVRYEDMLADPVAALAGSLQFLGEQTPLERVKVAADAAELSKLQAQEQAEGFLEASEHGRFFGPGGSRWRREMDPALAGRIVEVHGEVMEALGYDLS